MMATEVVKGYAVCERCGVTVERAKLSAHRRTKTCEVNGRARELRGQKLVPVEGYIGRHFRENGLSTALAPANYNQPQWGRTCTRTMTWVEARYCSLIDLDAGGPAAAAQRIAPLLKAMKDAGLEEELTAACTLIALSVPDRLLDLIEHTAIVSALQNQIARILESNGVAVPKEAL